MTTIFMSKIEELPPTSDTKMIDIWLIFCLLVPFFEAALSVNLTTMLVMTTIFISKMESLPPTSDTKMIDIWLILCQMVPFAEVVLLTAMEYNREEEEGEQRTDLVFAKANPSLEDEETFPESSQSGLNRLRNVVSKCKAPNLKNIGEL